MIDYEKLLQEVTTARTRLFDAASLLELVDMNIYTRKQLEPLILQIDEKQHKLYKTNCYILHRMRKYGK